MKLEADHKELVQYILINKDLNMTKGKIAAQVGHVCTLCALSEHETETFKHWLNQEQKKIILGVKQKTLEQLEKHSLERDFYPIRDNGHTEISPNSLTAISLGVKPKEAVFDITKRLQLL